MLADRLAQVEERIARAAGRAGRKRSDITLVAVTKVFPVETIEQAYAAGLRDFGENYVQEFEGKAPRAAALEGARFHLIGHLQTNKARRAAELFQVIQTVDTAKLAAKLDAEAAPLEVFLEVKLSSEQSKAGADPADVPALIEAVRGSANLKLMGLMTMPPWSDDPEQTRPYFRRLRQLADQTNLTCLSMGMSHDFEVAIVEGATHIRVGTALFGPRKKKV